MIQNEYFCISSPIHLMRIPIFLFFIIITSALQSNAQCGSTISNFPYNESFEAGTAGWTDGGLSSDWAWGTPNKSIIQSAGNGSKCWVTGGLNGAFYNFGQRSYVTSPCFNFTNVQFPHIKMKVYWDGENQYDGTTLQYSLNNGINWLNVGTNSDPVDCLNENWFNQSNINALNTLANPKHGWAGTILPTSAGCFGGSGSGGWVTAQHCISYLAGQPSVQFRFAFGAGTVCNAFDGFAFDDITIGEAPSNNASFSYNCTNTQLGYQFTNTSALCPTGFSWNFGDPSSGISNTSNSANPVHVFSSPGTYNVSLTVSGPCNQSSTITQTITTLNTTISATNPTCYNANNGSISSSATGGTGNLNQQLQPGAITNPVGLFNNLTANTYIVTITDAVGCSITSSIVLPNPLAINWSSILSTPITCNGNQNGQISASANGGVGSLTYTLNPGNVINSTGQFSLLNTGTYTIIATDGNNCSTSTTISLTQPNALVINTFNSTNIDCYNAQNGIINLSCSGGTGVLNYTLIPGTQTNTSGLFNNLNIGMYTVVITDANNCSLSTTTSITQASQIVVNAINIQNPNCNPNNNGSITVLATGGTGQLLYSIGGMFSSSNSFGSMTSNTYTVTVKDANNCIVTSSVTLLNPNAPNILSATATNVNCHGIADGTINVIATSNSTIDTYTLSPSNLVSSNGSFTELGSAIYTITVVDINGCSNTTVVQITEPEKMVVNTISYIGNGCNQNLADTILIICTGGSGLKTYTFSSTASITNTTGIFQINRAGEYSYKIVDQNNCFLTGIYSVPEKACCDNVILPNAFSPNKDLKNDELKIINPFGIDIKNFIVYNRWGQAVFTAQNINDSWDGNTKGIENEIGTYFYILTYRCLNSNKDYILKGDLLLIR